MSDNANKKQEKHSPSTKPSLSLLVPGLFTFNQLFKELSSAERESIKDFSFPVLSKWLSRGQPAELSAVEALYLENIFSIDREVDCDSHACFSLLAEDACPVEDIKHSNRSWLRADPVHLQPDRDTVRLLAHEEIQLSQDEADLVVTSINAHFVEEPWQLHAVAPHRWYIELSEDYKIDGIPHAHLIGCDINQYIPSGESSDYWLQVVNEIQMLLHGLNLNFERDSRGQLTVNSLWLWGYGKMTGDKNTQDDLHVYTDSQVINGLAQFRFDAAHALSEFFDQKTVSSDSLIVIDDLAGFSVNNDVYGFLQTLQKLEDTIFVKINELLLDKKISEIKLCIDAEDVLVVNRKLQRRWWKRVKPFIA